MCHADLHNRHAIVLCNLLFCGACVLHDKIGGRSLFLDMCPYTRNFSLSLSLSLSPPLSLPPSIAFRVCHGLLANIQHDAREHMTPSAEGKKTRAFNCGLHQWCSYKKNTRKHPVLPAPCLTWGGRSMRVVGTIKVPAQLRSTFNWEDHQMFSGR